MHSVTRRVILFAARHAESVARQVRADAAELAKAAVFALDVEKEIQAKYANEAERYELAAKMLREDAYREEQNHD